MEKISAKLQNLSKLKEISLDFAHIVSADNNIHLKTPSTNFKRE